MLTVEQNERLTKVGPGTPMGALMRRYWHPIAGEAEFEDRPTKRIRILGESLTLYKDKRGGYGLIGERCVHRGVNLATGIPEEDGLRCPYHGWKYDAKGQCIDQPAEPEGSTFKNKILIAAYPVQVLGGLVWAYLGPEPAPLLPRWDIFVWDKVFRQVGSTIVPCNWLQCQENAMDPHHAHFTHGVYGHYIMERMEERGVAVPDYMRRVVTRLGSSRAAKNGFDKFEHGVIKRRLLPGETEESENWRIGHPMVFPYMTRIGKKGWYCFQIRVPMDDTTTWHLNYEVFDPGPKGELPEQTVVPLFDVPIMEFPDYILGQDLMAWSEQGPISDRTQEHLGESDVGVIMYRSLLEEQMAVSEDGGDPMNVFRDHERNQRIDLPTEDYGSLRDYQEGATKYYDTGPHGHVEHMDQVFLKAKKAELNQAEIGD